MLDKSPDDIFALCSRFDLDQESYRVFPKREPITLSSNNPQSTISEAAGIGQDRLPTSERSLHVVTPNASETEDDISTVSQSNRTALRNLCRQIELSESKGVIRTFNDLLKTSIFVYGTAGGVGSTTVSATLARLFAKAGRSCAIVDGRDDSVLPFFFGEQRAIYDHKRFAGLHAAAETAVRIISRRVEENDKKNDGAADGKFWFEHSLSSAQKYLDYLLVDVQKGQEAVYPTTATGTALFVAVPDVSSLIGAKALKRILNEKAPGSRIICVLNKFDSSQTLHTEIRDWFEENFSQTLTLGRTDVVNEALAEGLTVVDWAPQSGIAANFLHLFTALQNLLPAPSNSQHGGGISLCS